MLTASQAPCNLISLQLTTEIENYRTYLPFPLENHRLSKVKHDMRKVMVGGLSHDIEKEVKTMDPVITC